jgi:hypothetical protein
MRTVAERFWSKVDVRGLDECWLWQGWMSKGCGTFSLGGRNVVASRIAYKLAHHVDPGNLLVCHTCDNPACVNPTHLWLGTAFQNMEDMRIKGRSRRFRGKLTEEQARAIKADTRSGAAIAAEYGVNPSSIYAIRRGRSWAHVDPAPTPSAAHPPARLVGDAAAACCPDSTVASPSRDPFVMGVM